MDRSAVKAVVDREIEGLLRQFGVSYWHVRVTYRPEKENEHGVLRRANCERLVDYNQATITLNPEAFDEEQEVLDVLAHEIFHIVLAPFDTYLNAVNRAIPEGPSADVLMSVWTHAMEQAVIGLGRMHLGIKGTTGPCDPTLTPLSPGTSPAGPAPG